MTSMLEHDNEIDLWELWEAVWSGRVLVVLVAGVFTLGGLAYGLLAPKWYKAEVVLAPVEQESPQVGALANLGLGLAGITLRGNRDQQSVAVLESKDFARDFINDLNLMPELLKGVRSGSKPLDDRDAVKVFERDVRAVEEDARTGLVTLTIRWKDPDTAALWANTLAKRLNDRLRQQAAAEAEHNVAYLKEELAGTSVVSLQQSIASILEAEMQKLMLARGNEEFAFRVIDRAVPPKEHDAPKRTLIAIACFLAGVFLSISFLVIRSAFRRRPRMESDQAS